ncbi:MAG: hypothetical protein ACXWT3_00285 [Methylococcaceae bacterium]
MNKTSILILMLLISNVAIGLPKGEVEKILRKNSIVVKAFNKLGIDIFASGKMLNKAVEPKPKTKVWVEGKNLRECMGKDKTINNNTVQCQSGYFKEVD